MKKNFFRFLIIIVAIFYAITYAQDIFTQAEIQLSQKKYREAIKDYQSVIRQSSNFEPAWFGLQTAYIQCGDLISAQKLEKILLSDRLLWGYIRTLFYSNDFDAV